MNAFNFNTTKSIISNNGAVSKIVDFCHQISITKPLIVTDHGIVNCGLLLRLTEHLSDASFAHCIYDNVSQDPHESVIYEGAKVAVKNNCDGVIGFGGGSSMDTAKLVALLASNKNSKLDDIYGVDQVTGTRLPLILIPTTAGTGSEVTPVSIVTTGDTTKAGVVANQLLPDIALLDASLTLGLPSYITAATGIDAIVHAIEAYTSNIKKNVYSDMLAIKAIQLLCGNIKEATFNGGNIDARQKMLLGACLAGQAFANAPVAAVHALAYPLGGHFHIPHGLSNSLVLPHVMRFNASHCSDLYAEIARQTLPNSFKANGSDIEVTEAFIQFLESLIAALELPTSLKEMDIEATSLPLLADEAIKQTRLLVNNPKPVSKLDALAIYQKAYGD